MNYLKIKYQFKDFSIFIAKLLKHINIYFNNKVSNLYSVENTIFYCYFNLIEFNEVFIFKLYQHNIKVV